MGKDEYLGYQRDGWIRIGLLGMELERLRLRLNDQHGEGMKREQREPFEKRFEERHRRYVRAVSLLKRVQDISQALEDRLVTWGGDIDPLLSTVTIEADPGISEPKQMDFLTGRLARLIKIELDEATTETNEARADLLQLGREEPPRDGGGE